MYRAAVADIMGTSLYRGKGLHLKTDLAKEMNEDEQFEQDLQRKMYMRPYRYTANDER